jgi:hypothetical protein
MKKILLVWIFCIFFFPNLTSGQEGSINWTEQYITTRGIGAYPETNNMSQKVIQARTAAIVLAQRDLLMLIKGIHITSETTIEDALVKNDTVKRQLEGNIRYAQILEEKTTEYGYEVLMGISLKDIRKALFQDQETKNNILKDQIVVANKKLNIPETSWKKDGKHDSISNLLSNLNEKNETLTEKSNTQNYSSQYGSTETSFSLELNESSIKIAEDHMNLNNIENYTSLIIDVRGLNLQPSMAPLLLNDKNEVVYGRVDIDADYVIENGIVRYINDPKDLNKLKDIGDKPLKIKAISIKDNFNPVIKYSDSRIVIAADKKSNILKDFKVIFIK